MLSIRTNLSSFIAKNSLQTSTNKLNQAIERMTTGAKINHAKDNAANYSISTNMTTKMNAYMVAEDNAAMGLDMVTTMSDTLELLNDHASRIRDLCEQASSGTYGEQSLKAIQSEIDARLEEIERIKSNAEYNGIKLFEGEEIDLSDGKGVTGSFIANVDQLTPDEAIAQGYTIIRTADELQAMKDDTTGKYILMNDINLQGYDWEPISDFTGEFNGNGYIIKNLTLDNPTQNHQALFASLGGNVMIKNLGITNANIKGQNYLGILAATSGGYDPETIQNVYVQGSILGGDQVGGLIGSICHALKGIIENCYADVNITADTYVGGLIGSGSDATPNILNSYITGSVKGNNYVGGIYGDIYSGCCDYVKKVYTSCSIQGNSNVGAIAGRSSSSPSYSDVYWDVDNCGIAQACAGGTYTGTITGVTSAELQNLIDNGALPSVNVVNTSGGTKNISLQVGINSDTNSQIKMSLESLKALESINATTSNSARSALSTLDDYINSIGNLQTNLGSVTNRLESVLDEISIQYTNLASSRSTIRDADIAEVSSQYIQQQILQQASATLLSSAQNIQAQNVLGLLQSLS